MAVNPYSAPATESPEPELDHRRPLVITLICLSNFAGSVLSVYLLWEALPTAWYRFGLWFTVYSVANLVLSVLCYVGFWRMSRWAVYLFVALAATGYAVELVYQVPTNPVRLFLESIVLLVGLIYYRKMRWRL